MNDFSKMSIGEIENWLNSVEPTEELQIKLAQDNRKGVQRLAQKIERKLVKQAELEQQFLDMLEFEKAYWNQGFELIAGVDEVGRGPLAGPVVAAAVIIKPDFYLPGLNDSKQLSETQREEFYQVILQKAFAVGIGIVDNRVIDEINILQASFKAMTLALGELVHKGTEPEFIFVDGDKQIPGLVTFQKPIVGGDGMSVSIAAASVVAKVTRDRMMVEFAEKYPGYGFERNKGYGSAEHILGLHKLGITPIHRMSYSIVKQINQADLTEQEELA